MFGVIKILENILQCAKCTHLSQNASPRINFVWYIVRITHHYKGVVKVYPLIIKSSLSCVCVFLQLNSFTNVRVLFDLVFIIFWIKHVWMKQKKALIYRRCNHHTLHIYVFSIHSKMYFYRINIKLFCICKGVEMW